VKELGKVRERLLGGLFAALPVLFVTAPPAVGAEAFDRRDVRLAGQLMDATVVRLADGRARLAVLVTEPKLLDEEGDETDAADETGGERSRAAGPRVGGAPDGPSSDDDRGRGEHTVTVSLGAGGPEAFQSASGDDESPAPDSSLLLIDVRTGRTDRLAGDLPASSRRIAAVARPGAADLLVVSAGGGENVSIDPDGAARGSLASAFGAGGVALVTERGLSAGAADQLAVERPGRLLLAVPAGGGAGLAAAGSFALPRQAERKGWGLRITSPPVHGVPGGCWAAGPVAAGPRRLHTLLYCAGAEEPLETWALLPRAETVRQARFLRHAGRPVLAVLTSEQTGLFVKQALRLFPLEASRNRVGAEPLLAADTGCPMWRRSTLGLADADGDGRDDLVLVCEQGLVDPELRVEVYPGEDGGGFVPRARDAKLDGAYGSWHFGDDWTGDGLPDLAAVRDEALHVHAGSPRRRPIDKRPAAVVEIAATDGDGPAFDVVVGEDGDADGGGFTIEHGGTRILGTADLDGDGRPELVLVRQTESEGTISVLSPR
jgi:hypothetical protein